MFHLKRHISMSCGSDFSVVENVNKVSMLVIATSNHRRRKYEDHLTIKHRRRKYGDHLTMNHRIMNYEDHFAMNQRRRKYEDHLTMIVFNGVYVPKRVVMTSLTGSVTVCIERQLWLDGKQGMVSGLWVAGMFANTSRGRGGACISRGQ
jgi:hypothetical protein